MSWTSLSTTTFRGAWGVESCLPIHSQLSPEAGQAYFAPDSAMQALLISSSAASLDGCLAQCDPGYLCLAQWDATTQSCKTVSLAPAAADATSGMQLVYKLPPSTLGSASSIQRTKQQKRVSAKTMSSGYYAFGSIPDSDTAAWQTAGFNLGADARTFAAGATAAWDSSSNGGTSCRTKCGESNVCWGFIYDASNGVCLYRGGVDANATRSFFVIPTAVDLGALHWSNPSDTTPPRKCWLSPVMVSETARCGARHTFVVYCTWRRSVEDTKRRPHQTRGCWCQ